MTEAGEFRGKLIAVDGVELSVSVFPHTNADNEKGFILQHEYHDIPESRPLVMWNFYGSFDEAESALPMINIIAARAVKRRLEEIKVKDDRASH